MSAESTSPQSTAQDFFETYASAVVARDAEAVADLYCVPSLVLFPAQPLPVADRQQVRTFFADAAAQRGEIEEASPAVEVIASAPDHSIWADVTWSYDGTERERFVYQLVRDHGSWLVAVLTPMPL